MLKTQKTFSPLNCKLCDRFDCKFRLKTEHLYSIGYMIQVNDCLRLQQQRADEKRYRGRT